ncbi:hypothetical protein ABTH92_21130, partial [Acinetobacter baumannii]
RCRQPKRLSFMLDRAAGFFGVLPLGERRRRSGFEALYIDCRVVREGLLSDSKSTVQAGYTF